VIYNFHAPLYKAEGTNKQLSSQRLNFFTTFARMSLYLASINSGSNGNCYYIGNREDAVLVDAGISCRETEQRLMRLGLSMNKIRAIFISHEHTDHTLGADVLSRKHKIPVYITPETYRSSKLSITPHLIRSFLAHETISIASLSVHPFPKEHDGVDSHSFTVSFDGVTAGVFTDIGAACPNVIHQLGRCHAAFLEANYDETMLETGRYPLFLKRRIRGGRGHLSNMQSLELFMSHAAPFLGLLILSHLSEQNNHPEIVHRLFTTHANGTRIAVASRYRETGVFYIGA